MPRLSVPCVAPLEARLSGNGSAPVLTVFDDGKGMDEEVLRRQGSTGLGLMVYRAKVIGPARGHLGSRPRNDGELLLQRVGL